MDFKTGDLNNVDIHFKFISLPGSRFKKLSDVCFYKWKIISLHLLSKYFDSSFKFHSKLHFESKILEDFPSFYKKMLINRKKYIISPPITPSCILSQFLRYSSYIQIDNKAGYLKFFSTNSVNFITQLFHSDGSLKHWKFLKTEYALQNKDHFC